MKLVFEFAAQRVNCPTHTIAAIGVGFEFLQKEFVPITGDALFHGHGQA